MIGSIIGDIVGSIYEFNNIKTKDFPLFTNEKEFTDDSVLCIATAQWILDCCKKSPSFYYADFASRYEYVMGGYGTGFQNWLVKAIRQDTYEKVHQVVPELAVLAVAVKLLKGGGVADFERGGNALGDVVLALHTVGNGEGFTTVRPVV